MASKSLSAAISHERVANLTRRRIKELVPAQSVEESSQKWVSCPLPIASDPTRNPDGVVASSDSTASVTATNVLHSIKKPKTHRYPSLKGTDPKFRRNHRHALHGTMKALKEVKEGKRDAA